jgi:6-phosphogluconate dehydrogenase
MKGGVMELGMIGLGRMGAGMVRRLMRGGHRCIVHDRAPDAIRTLSEEGAVGAHTLAELVRGLERPRAICLMVPAASVNSVLAALVPLLEPEDAIIDAGNSHYQDDIARAERVSSRGLHYVDLGTSGGIWGLERGYCLMIGGDKEVVRRLEPLFESLAPGRGTIPPTPDRRTPPSTSELGFLHCGPSGAGHFVKMIHNGIEYGLMAAYAEGFNILANAGRGGNGVREGDAETASLRHPEHYRYDFRLEDIAELWRRGSVVSSWLLDLTSQALASDPGLNRYQGRVSDSGEGRWTVAAANDLGVPVPVLAGALFERYASRGAALFQDKMLSAMRLAFGGHVERMEVGS